MSEMVKVAAWNLKAATNYAANTDEFAWVEFQDSATQGAWHPLIQGSANAKSWVRYSLAAETARGTFGDGDNADVAIQAS